MKNTTTNIDYIFLGIFGVGAVAVFTIEVIFPNPQPSQHETALYNALELGLSLGFGWVLQRIESKKQFHENLKQFALSAYRRISDIEKSVSRIRKEIGEMRPSYNQSKVHELDILGIVVEEMDNTVSSSIADWADIIGDELSKKERIEELEKEQNELKKQQETTTSAENTDQRMSELRKEIDSLRASLPYLLRTDPQSSLPKDDTFPTEGRLNHSVIEHYRLEVKSHSCITIFVHPIVDISSQEYLDKIKSCKTFTIKSEQNMFTVYATLWNTNGDKIGDIMNPFSDIYQNDFIISLLTLLGPITKKSGTLSWVPDCSDTFIIEPLDIVRTSSDRNSCNLLLKLSATVNDFAVG